MSVSIRSRGIRKISFGVPFYLIVTGDSGQRIDPLLKTQRPENAIPSKVCTYGSSGP